MRFSLFFFIGLFSFVTSFAQIDSAAVRLEINEVGGVGTLLKKIESFGERREGNDALHQSAEWLKQQYLNYGYTDVQFDSFSVLNGDNYNVVVTKPSQTPNAPLLIIGSHYDSKGGAGVNDNGTGVAATLKIAENLIDKESPFTIQFIHFAGEEQGLFGSQHQAEKLFQSGDSLFLYYNLDQLGGTKGATDNYQIICERDQDNNPPNNNVRSAAITQQIADVIAGFTSLKTSIDRAFQSDYEPYQVRGYTITGLYQFSDYPFEHSAADSLGNVDTGATLEITKGALASILVLMKAKGIVSVSKTAIPDLKLYPNPTRDHLWVSGLEDYSNLRYSIYQMDGRELQNGILNEAEIKLNNIRNGVYLLRIYNNEISVIKRFGVGKE